jgi:maleylpyruvate isomerase
MPAGHGRFVRVGTDPLGLTEDVRRATERMLVTARRLDSAAVAAPSLLPGWSRGHVLTHIARNADGAVNLLTWARTGVMTPQYASWEARVADIEAGAPRPAADQIDDLTAACERFAAAVDAMPDMAWSHTVRSTTGPDRPAATVMWSRLQEVEVHHVDLDAGYTPSDWPAAFVLRLLRSLEKDRAGNGPDLVVRAPEVGHDVTIGASSVTAPVVTGAASALVAWLIGRSAGDGLTVDPPGRLPAVPAWR